MDNSDLSPMSSPGNGAARQARLRLAVILNGGGGTMLTRGVTDVRNALAAAFESHAISADLTVCRGEEIAGKAEDALRRAREGLVDAVVAGGGDGTIRTVAGILAGSDVPLGVLPLGTLNHFARDLAIPPELDEAVAVIASGTLRRVDIAEVNGHVFINNSSVGIYPYMVIDRERQMSRSGLLKWSAMVLALLRVLRRFPTRRLAIYAQGRAEPCRTPLLFIGNNEYGLDLFSLGHRKDLDAGHLWLYYAKARNPLELVLLAVRLCLGSAGSDPGLESMESRNIEVRSRTSRLLVALDGEVETLHPPLLYRARPGDLTVFAPPPETA